MAQCTGKTISGSRCQRQARSGGKRCATHLTSRVKRVTTTNKDPLGTAHEAIRVLGFLKNRATKGEMRKRIQNLVRNIQSYFLAIGPYLEELGL
jgi:hypothetical protein